MTPREPIFSALFGLLNGVTWNDGEERQFVTRTREIKLFSDVHAKSQPWIGQAEHAESVTQGTNLPYRNVWKATWLIYHKGPSPRSIWNNLMIDALARALEPSVSDPGYFDGRNTLSGLVWKCFIDGEVFKDPGDIDGQALVTIPITLLVP